ncbi:MAG: hypothetical protein OEW58_02880 [Gammaproteobacteria bacterium]|nr:hypothetical protein [Gammaproteobacteria bacterium]
MQNNNKIRLMEFSYGTLAIGSGALLIFLGGYALNVSMDVFYGIATFNPLWMINLFFVTFIAGIVVSLVYGLGGKMLAHFAPLPVYFYNYASVDKYSLPEGVTLLPFFYWILIVILAVEFCGLGGFLGEVIIKKTYGRRPKHLIHRRYQLSIKQRLQNDEGSETNP